jgi:lysophospholipase L1-like esterase
LRRARATALAIGLALAALVAWPFLRARHQDGAGAPGITVEGNLAAIDAFLAERARSGPAPLPPGPGPHLVREPVPEDVAVRLFPQLVLSKRGVEYDERCYYRYRPRLRRVIPFAERPEGEWVFRTNSAGLREDVELAERRPDLRVVVAGDSQTEGVCSNDESWPNLLEAGLARAAPGRRVEVLNTGKAGYHVYNYLGVLEKYLELEPDLFVVGLYGGNDFAEAMILHHYFRRTPRPSCERCDRDAMLEVRDDQTVGYHTQALRQVQTFRHHPEEREAALEAALATVAECARLCSERGIGFLLVHLPPMVDAQPRFLGPDLDRALEVYGLARPDLAVSGELADRVLAFAASKGAATTDLREVFAKVERQLYWNRDHHLSVAGNHVVAGVLVPRVEGLIAGR